MEQVFKDGKGRELPTISLAGDKYVIDLEHEQLFSVATPRKYIGLNNLELASDADSYECFFDLKSRTITAISPHIMHVPDNVVMLRIPMDDRLDPVWYRRQHGWDDKIPQQDQPVSKELQAEMIPLRKTYVARLALENIMKAFDKRHRVNISMRHPRRHGR